MDKSKIIKSVKRQEEEKVAVSLKLPASLKEQLQKIGEQESISMNALIVATLHSMVDDDCGKQLRNAKSLLFSMEGDIRNNLEAIEQYGIDADNYSDYSHYSNLLKQIDEMRGN